MNWVNGKSELLDFISLVMAYAPHDFPKRDFLSEDEQLNLEKAFYELERGLSLSKIEEIKNLEAKHVLQQALVAYRQGDDSTGVRLLQRFRREVFGHD